jgi:hypothetical protein
MPTLPFRHRLRMAWELSWPLALIDLAVAVLIHGVLDARGETLDSVWALVAFFAVSPWIVRRAIGLRYGDRKIAVLHPAAEARALTYQESLKVMWLLAWRSLVLGLAALLVISAAIRLACGSFRFTIDDPLVNAIGLSAVDVVTTLVFAPFLIPGMLRKRYRGFRLELVTESTVAKQRDRSK